MYCYAVGECHYGNVTKGNGLHAIFVYIDVHAVQ